jgi:hypothetical protein
VSNVEIDYVDDDNDDAAKYEATYKYVYASGKRNFGEIASPYCGDD